jgi:hypothetical protein
MGGRHVVRAWLAAAVLGMTASGMPSIPAAEPPRIDVGPVPAGGLPLQGRPRADRRRLDLEVSARRADRPRGPGRPGWPGC